MVPRMMTPKAGNMIREWVESKASVCAPARASNVSTMAAGDAPLSVKLSTGESLPCDVVIVAAGVAPNVSFLEGSPVHVFAKGVLVDDRMQTSGPGIYAAEMAEAPDLFTGAHLVSAIQPNAVDQARVAAINMAGGDARMPGCWQSTFSIPWASFPPRSANGGRRRHAGVEQDEAGFRYISLQFRDDVLVGATSIGLTDHVGFRGLIQGNCISACGGIGCWPIPSPSRPMLRTLSRWR